MLLCNYQNNGFEMKSFVSSTGWIPNGMYVQIQYNKLPYKFLLRQCCYRLCCTQHIIPSYLTSNDSVSVFFHRNNVYIFFNYLFLFWQILLNLFLHWQLARNSYCCVHVMPVFLLLESRDTHDSCRITDYVPL